MIMLTLTTPALLFSAISLLLLAYTNRFLALAQLVRNLYAQYKQNANSILLGQIKNLRRRVHIIRYMQILGITSLLLCVLSMFLIYVGESVWAEVIFGIALLLLIASLALSVWEIQISVKALDIHLSDIENKR
ncbi:MAG TPA: DUF2721 domain-containing protein [Bacteroidetes bacterium]|nr:DUF2721 domain-containing protein [Bacteroidota bacterium]